MSNLRELEKEILSLSPAEREQLAAVVWESLVSDPEAAGNREIDPEGVQLAAQRDAEIESGKIQPIDHAEFLRRTGDASE
jgi:hypothetical protein